MTLVKDSLQFLISQLSPGDCMGLVSYDEDVCTEIPLTFLDDSGKVQYGTSPRLDDEVDLNVSQDSVLKAVSNIRTGLWTNLSGGLFSALQLLSQLPYDAQLTPTLQHLTSSFFVYNNRSSHSNMVCSILLFTDGGANRGITQTCVASYLLAYEGLVKYSSICAVVMKLSRPWTWSFGSYEANRLPLQFSRLDSAPLPTPTCSRMPLSIHYIKRVYNIGSTVR